MMMFCQDEDAEAPRDGCRCHECYRARERLLDERLVEMVRHSLVEKSPKRSGRIIYGTVQHYLAGSCDLTTLYIELIKRLAADSDAAFDRELQMAMLKPSRHFIPTES